jgi:NADP-dependent 3-hydroxy acid dehydrogenase YdfG
MTLARRALLFTMLCAGTLSASPAHAQQRAVLVTGASSGIGRKITERLASQGHFVYAGARSAQDIAELSAIRNVQGIRLDVTAPAEITAAVETVRKGGRGLYGVVNNAGIAIIAPLIQAERRTDVALRRERVRSVPCHEGVCAAAD